MAEEQRRGQNFGRTVVADRGDRIVRETEPGWGISLVVPVGSRIAHETGITIARTGIDRAPQPSENSVAFAD